MNEKQKRMHTEFYRLCCGEPGSEDIGDSVSACQRLLDLAVELLADESATSAPWRRSVIVSRDHIAAICSALEREHAELGYIREDLEGLLGAPTERGNT